MGVVVDESGGNDAAGGIYVHHGLFRKAAHTGDLPILNGHVGLLMKAVLRVDDCAVSNDDLIHIHTPLQRNGVGAGGQRPARPK